MKFETEDKKHLINRLADVLQRAEITFGRESFGKYKFMANQVLMHMCDILEEVLGGTRRMEGRE